MSKENEYVQVLNQEHNVSLTGLSPLYGNGAIPKSATKIVVKDFGNGLGRVLYVDDQNRLIANNMELLAGK